MQKLYIKYMPLFFLPAFIAYIIAFGWPFIQGLYLSLTEFQTVSNAEFVGFENYLYVFTDSEGFLHALWFTVLFAIVSVITVNLVAFGLALLLTRGLKGTNVFRTVFFMPNLIGGIVLGYIWQIMLNGILVELVGRDLTFSATYGYWGLVVMYSWQFIGYMMIIYVAGLQNISGDILEASAIDGANSFQTLIRIKLPMVMTSITICVFLTLTNAFKMFDQNLALTGGAPADQTAMLALDIYDTYYNRPGFAGIGQAKAVVFFIIVALVAAVQLRITRSREVD